MNTHLKSFRLQNFKAVKDSKVVKLTPLTVFIGNNGSGKSSLIEGLQAIQDIVDDGLDGAMQLWSGFEHIWHQGVEHKPRNEITEERIPQSNPMRFEFRGKGERDFGKFSAKSEITLDQSGDELFFYREEVQVGDWKHTREQSGKTNAEYIGKEKLEIPPNTQIIPLVAQTWGGVTAVTFSQRLFDDESLLQEGLGWYISNWQFLSLSPENMGRPNLQKRTGGDVVLARDGSNIAEYLLSIRKIDQNAFDGIIESLNYVLPYAEDLQPSVITQLERSVFLQLTEKDFKIPGWLLSSGTLRLLAILAVLRHPHPPPLIVIEEIENGFDPRTLNLIVDEIREAIGSGKTQVLVTTHSPYFLDLLHLSQIVIVERKDREPTFSRPADREDLNIWNEKFSLGDLYTMGKLKSNDQKTSHKGKIQIKDAEK